MAQVIDFSEKFEMKQMVAELKRALDTAEQDSRCDPALREILRQELAKAEHAFELLKLTVDRGYDPKQFLKNPWESGSE